MDNSTMLVAAHSSQGVFLRSLGLVDEALDIYGKALDISNSGVFGDNPDADAGNENWACAVRRRVGKGIQGACAPMVERWAGALLRRCAAGAAGGAGGAIGDLGALGALGGAR